MWPGMPKLPKNNMFAVSLQYLKEEVSDEVNFCMQISMTVSCKLILWFLMEMVKYLQSSKNSNFVMSLQYLKKKEVGDEVDFLHADKHQNFIQVYFNTLGIKVSYKVILSLLIGMIKHSQSTQSKKFAISLQCL